MRSIVGFALAWTLGTTLLGAPVLAQEVGRYGARIGAGTDITGGVAYGGQIDYTLFRGPDSFEAGLLLFGGSFEEESNNGFNDYFETTDILVFAAIGNYLFRHSMDTEGPYFVAGAGAGAISVAWREESPTDTSLGSPLAGGGSFQEEDGFSGGLILSAGLGHRFSEDLDLRVQIPTFFISGGEERDGAVVPTLTVTLGFAF
jgi:hypothetical protein